MKKTEKRENNIRRVQRRDKNIVQTGHDSNMPCYFRLVCIDDTPPFQSIIYFFSNSQLRPHLPQEAFFDTSSASHTNMPYPLATLTFRSYIITVPDMQSIIQFHCPKYPLSSVYSPLSPPQSLASTGFYCVPLTFHKSHGWNHEVRSLSVWPLSLNNMH